MTDLQVCLRLHVGEEWVLADRVLAELDEAVSLLLGEGGGTIRGGFFVELGSVAWNEPDSVATLLGTECWLCGVEVLVQGTLHARAELDDGHMLHLRRKGTRVEIEQLGPAGEPVCARREVDLEELARQIVDEGRRLEAIRDAVHDKLQAITWGREVVLSPEVRERIDAVRASFPESLSARLDALELLCARADASSPAASSPAAGNGPATMDPRLADAVERLEHEDRGVRVEALFEIERRSSSAAAAVPAVRRLLEDDDVAFRIGAVVVLASVGGDGALEGLETALADEDADVRVQAAEALIHHRARDSRVVVVLDELLGHDDPATRSEALRLLGDAGPDAAIAVDRIRTVVNGAGEWWLNRVRAIEALGAIGLRDDAILAVLTEARDAGDWNVRRAATQALVRFGAIHDDEPEPGEP